MSALWALDEADKLMAAEGIPKEQRPFRSTEFVRRVLAGETADAPEASAAPAPAPVSVLPPAQEDAPPAAVTRPDPWIAALAEVNGEVAAQEPEPAAQAKPEAPAASAPAEVGDVWARALAKVNAEVKGA